MCLSFRLKYTVSSSVSVTRKTGCAYLLLCLLLLSSPAVSCCCLHLLSLAAAASLFFCGVYAASLVLLLLTAASCFAAAATLGSRWNGCAHMSSVLRLRKPCEVSLSNQMSPPSRSRGLSPFYSEMH